MAAANTKFAMVLLRALAVIGYRARGLNWSRSSRWCLVVNLICEHALAGMLEQYRFESDLELAEKQVTWFDVARRERGSRRLDPEAQDGIATMRTNSSVCLYCGQPLSPQPRVTGRERRRLVEILARRPDGMTRRELADWLYADDPNGGPENTLEVCQLVHIRHGCSLPRRAIRS